MKSEYREAVESVIAQEAKLAEVSKLCAEATEKAKQLASAMQLNRETLERYEARVLEIESKFSH